MPTECRYNIERSWEASFREVEHLCTEFALLGLKTVGRSRLGAYRAAFRKLEAAVHGASFEIADAARVLETIVEFQQLRRVMAAARASRNTEAWTARLRRLVSGPPYPALAGADPSGSRDIQFECVLAAVFELSGIEVEFVEPDLRIRFLERTAGIAAKRPRNKTSIIKNFAKAASQLRRAKTPGIVGLDLSWALYGGQCINTNDMLGASAFAECAANDAVRQLIPHIVHSTSAEGAIGVLVQINVPVLNLGHPSGPQVQTAIRWTLASLLPHSREWDDWIIQLAREAEKGMFSLLPGDDRVNRL